MDQLVRYLSLLGVPRGAPDFRLLLRLLQAQIQRVPFENISKLYRVGVLGERGLPSLEEHLDGIEHRHLGGTCYANNWYLYLLLERLGFDVRFCGADMASGPDVHTVLIVRLDGREYLVDAGYGAPFFEPLPRDLKTAHVVAFGNERYILHPRDEVGRSRLDHERDGELIHGYVAKPEPRDIRFFQQVILESNADTAMFLNAIMIRRFFPDRSLTIFNHTLIESTPSGITKTHLKNHAATVDAIVGHFDLSRALVETATQGMGPLGGVHS